MKQKENLLKNKKVVASFAIAALIGGFLFLNPSLTGSAISIQETPLNLLSLIGILLIACAIVLAAYSLKKK